jgi:hypothetical protein
MSTEKKKNSKRDQALNDATSGQFGEEPSDIPEFYYKEQEGENIRKKTARKISKTMN